jgi:RNA exonuclease 1
VPLLAVIAIDCEMCETVDPITGMKDTNALVRFTAINGLYPDEVLVDTLVRPRHQITDMRTAIHGIRIDQLQGTTCTLREVQFALDSICSQNTIIVGHSVSNDLKALKFKHR